jgi:hypothetical protein
MENNPLRQYFRRPAVYLRLPSNGVGYPAGSIDMPETGELPIFPMTAVDEITARTPDALFNGSAVTDLIKSCVPNIKDPWVVNSNDLDALIIAIRIASGGDKLEVESQCPSCEEAATYDINLSGVLGTFKAADYSEELEIGELKIKLRPLSFKEMNESAKAQFEIQKVFSGIAIEADQKKRDEISHTALEQITKLTMELLSGAIEYIKTPTSSVTDANFITDFLENCDREIYIKIRDHNSELRKSTELKPAEVKCINCGHNYEQPYTLNPSDFFA